MQPLCSDGRAPGCPGVDQTLIFPSSAGSPTQAASRSESQGRKALGKGTWAAGGDRATAAQWRWYQNAGSTMWLQEQALLPEAVASTSCLARFQTRSGPASPHVENGMIRGTLGRAAGAHAREMKRRVPRAAKYLRQI